MKLWGKSTICNYRMGFARQAVLAFMLSLYLLLVLLSPYTHTCGDEVYVQPKALSYGVLLVQHNHPFSGHECAACIWTRNNISVSLTAAVVCDFYSVNSLPLLDSCDYVNRGIYYTPSRAPPSC